MSWSSPLIDCLSLERRSVFFELESPLTDTAVPVGVENTSAGDSTWLGALPGVSVAGCSAAVAECFATTAGDAASASFVRCIAIFMWSCASENSLSSRSLEQKLPNYRWHLCVDGAAWTTAAWHSPNYCRAQPSKTQLFDIPVARPRIKAPYPGPIPRPHAQTLRPGPMPRPLRPIILAGRC